MSTQLSMVDIFSGKPDPPVFHDLEAGARKTDPRSSKRAAREIEKSGVLRGNRNLVLALIKQYPGHTSKQLAMLGKVDRHMVARRCADLRNMRLVKSEETGEKDLVWWPL